MFGTPDSISYCCLELNKYIVFVPNILTPGSVGESAHYIDVPKYFYDNIAYGEEILGKNCQIDDKEVL